MTDEPTQPSKASSPSGERALGHTEKRDHESGLFAGASDKARELFAESKRVRRAVERRQWWTQHGKDKQ